MAPNKTMQANAANILAYVGDLIGGGFWKQVMLVAVLGGTLASLQAAIAASSARPSNLVLGGFLAVLGAAFMAFVIIYSLASGSLNGVEIAFGFGLALAGLVISFVIERTAKPKPPFYSDPTASHGDHIEEDLAGPEAA